MLAQLVVSAAVPALVRGVQQHEHGGEERGAQSSGELFETSPSGDTKCFLHFQASAHLDLGVRAGQKLREMARREEEEEVKTKVSKIHIRFI